MVPNICDAEGATDIARKREYSRRYPDLVLRHRRCDNICPLRHTQSHEKAMAPSGIMMSQAVDFGSRYERK